MAAGDRIDISDLISGSLDANAESAAADVGMDGEWHYDGVTGILTVFNDDIGNAGTPGPVTVDIGMSLTLTADVTDEVIAATV